MIADEAKFFRRPSQGNLDNAVRVTSDRVRHAVNAYVRDGSEYGFGLAMIDALTEGHTTAGVIGRRRAGDYAPEEADDRKFAEGVMDSEQEFLDGFVSDLGSGRYIGEDGALDTEAIRKRALLYPSRMTGTANETFALASGDDEINWVLGEAEHCEGEGLTCVEIEAGNPYTALTLPTHPGSNLTPCLFNCRCNVLRADGTTGFKVPE